jgi:hypothetical protein
MTPDQQQRAIEKVCGWKPLPEGYFHPDNPIGQTPPDYLNDRNAMQEAKQSLLDKGLMLEFANLLVVIICSAKGISWSNLTTDYRQMLIANATAGQEAETFLKVLKLWEEKQIPEPSFHSYHKEDAQ